MPKRTNLAIVAVDAQANALAALLDGGFVDFFDGRMPKTANEAPGASVRLASLRLASPAFDVAIDGSITTTSIAPDLDAGWPGAPRAATWARFFRKDHKTPVMDVTVGSKDAVIIFEATAIPQHAEVGIDAFTHTVPRQAAMALT
jgi:hypothetical protein